MQEQRFLMEASMALVGRSFHDTFVFQFGFWRNVRRTSHAETAQYNNYRGSIGVDWRVYATEWFSCAVQRPARVLSHSWSDQSDHRFRDKV